MTAAIKTISAVGTLFEPSQSRWRWLYRAGGVAALLSVVFLPIQVLVFIISPPPESALGWFTLFQTSRLVGLLDLDLLLVVDQVLAILIFLALYAALRRVEEAWMAIALAFGLVSAVLFIASNPAGAMLALSETYASATTEAQKAMLLAAGQALLANWEGSAFQASYILGSATPIIMSAVMLRGRVRMFSRATAYWGIAANGVALGYYVPEVGIYISVFSVVFLWIWYALIARRLLQLGQAGAQPEGAHE